MKLSPEELNRVIEEAPRNEKGQPVIPDDVFVDNANDLPKGTRSESGYCKQENGYTTPFIKGESRTKEIASMGAQANKEAWGKRKTMAETIDIYLKKTDKDGVSNQDKIIMGMIEKAMSGCVGASEFLRDTVGEKPSDNLNLDVMTEADKQLIENLKARINELKGTKG